MDCIVDGVATSPTWLRDFHFSIISSSQWLKAVISFVGPEFGKKWAGQFVLWWCQLGPRGWSLDVHHSFPCMSNTFVQPDPSLRLDFHPANVSLGKWGSPLPSSHDSLRVTAWYCLPSPISIPRGTLRSFLWSRLWSPRMSQTAHSFGQENPEHSPDWRTEESESTSHVGCSMHTRGGKDGWQTSLEAGYTWTKQNRSVDWISPGAASSIGISSLDRCA